MPSLENQRPFELAQSSGESPPHLPKILIGDAGEDPPYYSGPIRAIVGSRPTGCIVTVQSVSETIDGVEVFSGCVVGVTTRKPEERAVLLSAVFQNLQQRGFECRDGHERVQVVEWTGPYFFVEGNDRYPSGALKDMIVLAAKEIEQHGIETVGIPIQRQDLNGPPVARHIERPSIDSAISGLDFNTEPTAAVQELRLLIMASVSQIILRESLSPFERFTMMNAVMTDISSIFSVSDQNLVVPERSQSPAVAEDDLDFGVQLTDRIQSVRELIIQEMREKASRVQLSVDERFQMISGLMRDLTSLLGTRVVA